MSLTFADIQKTIDLLGPPPIHPNPIYISKDLATSIKELCFPTDRISGIEIHVTDLLPFKRKYGACDIATRMEYFIEGEEIHAVMVPAIQPLKEERTSVMQIAWDLQKRCMNSWEFILK